MSPPAPTFHMQVDGQVIPAQPGQTVAAALIASGRLAFHHSPGGAPRGLFCGMGVCFDCLVTIDGVPDQRACMTLARPGMHVQLLNQEGRHEHD